MSIPETLTAIVTTYKRHEELDGALANLINQDRQPDEIIVIDRDPEGSGKRAPHAADPLVRYFVTPEPISLAAAYNFAIKAAKGEILLFHTDDARFEKYTATTLLMDYFKNPTVACQCYLIRGAANRLLIQEEYPGTNYRAWDEVRDVSYFCSCVFSIRKSIFAEIGDFDDTYIDGEQDLDLSYRMLKAKQRIVYLPTVLAYHRIIPGRETTEPLPYRMVRNRTYFAAKHLPFPFVLSHLTIWSAISFFEGVRGKSVNECVRGIKSLWGEKLWARAKQYRLQHQPTWDMVKYLMKHQGRVFY